MQNRHLILVAISIFGASACRNQIAGSSLAFVNEFPVAPPPGDSSSNASLALGNPSTTSDPIIMNEGPPGSEDANKVQNEGPPSTRENESTPNAGASTLPKEKVGGKRIDLPSGGHYREVEGGEGSAQYVYYRPKETTPSNWYWDKNTNRMYEKPVVQANVLAASERYFETEQDPVTGVWKCKEKIRSTPLATPGATAEATPPKSAYNDSGLTYYYGRTKADPNNVGYQYEINPSVYKPSTDAGTGAANQSTFYTSSNPFVSNFDYQNATRVDEAAFKSYFHSSGSSAVAPVANTQTPPPSPKPVAKTYAPPTDDKPATSSGGCSDSSCKH